MARKHALIQEYELFKMQQGETIIEVQKRFTHIINHLIGLGKKFDKGELNMKDLKCFDRNWQPKVIVISESKDLSRKQSKKGKEHSLEKVKQAQGKMCILLAKAIQV